MGDRTSSRPLREVIADHAAHRPEAVAYVADGVRTSWAAYDAHSTRLARALLGAGLRRGERVAVVLPDTAAVHVAFTAGEKAGVVVVGIGARAGERELAHLLGRTGARAVVTVAEHRGRDTAATVARLREELSALRHHVVVAAESGEPVAVDGVDPVLADPGELAARGTGPEELWLLNSTSGTTGLPKCVTQTQARWLHYHRYAVDAADLSSDDVFFSPIPAPFGFGLWTAHVTPTLLGVPTVLMPRFDADEAVRLIEAERVSVLLAVSTQFIMMLGSPEIERCDLSSLRILFTGGEAIPYGRAREFEERTGATILNFYGSNETGALSYTTVRDPVERRLTTGGRVIEDMHVRLFDLDGTDITGTGEQGRPAGKGPALSPGYYDDEAANAELFTPDGWMLMGDLVTIDTDGYLRVVGRTSDFIIRGGKNISAPAVEQEVATHPAVTHAAAVAVPDSVFGERVGVFVVLRAGQSLELADLVGHLESRGVSKEWFPEHLVVVPELPMASGGKVAKSQLREQARALVGD